MSAESQMVFEIWEAVRDLIPAGKRSDVAELIISAVAEYGFEYTDLAEIVDEDRDLADAYNTVFSDVIEDEIDEEE